MIKIVDKKVPADAEIKFLFEEDNEEFGKFQKVKTCGTISIGLGKKEKLTDERLKRAIGDAVRELPNQGIKTILIDAKAYSTKALVEGAILGNYFFNKYKSKKENGFLKEIYLMNIDKKEFEEAKIIAEAVNFARDLSNEPAATIYPESFAKIASELNGVEFWDEVRLKKEKFYGTLTVGKGSDKPPRAVIIKHMKGTSKPIVLIGKGVTFDSGGYNLKNSKGMALMYTDMSGGAAVLGTMKAVQELNIKKNIIGIIPLAENLISGRSYKPGDIITAMNDVSVEIGNTDAEGRLLLMDALAYSQSLDAEAVIDLATLTGAVSYALGSLVTGAFTEKDELWKKLYDAGETSGDRVWRLPCWEEYDIYIKGDVADWSNSGRGKPGSITAARFLEKFAPDNWIHLDIAGTARMEEDMDYFRKGSTGAGVRLLVEFLKN